jgi:tetratricopeptide (TPR) repeat protein
MECCLDQLHFGKYLDILSLHKKDNEGNNLGLNNCLTFGLALALVGNMEEAIEYINNKETSRLQQIYIAYLYSEGGTVRETDRILDEINYENLTLIEETLISLLKGRVSIGLRRLDNAKLHLEQCIEKIREEYPKSIFIIFALNDLGTMNRRKEEFQKAEDYHNQALKIAKDIKCRYEEANCYNNLAITRFWQSRFDESLIFHDKAITIRKELNDWYKLSISYINKAACFSEMGELRNAIECSEKCLEVLKIEDDKMTRSIALNNIGNNLRLLGEFNKAMPYLLNALELSRDLNDVFGISEVAINIYRIYHTLGELDKAKEYLMRYKDTIEELGNNTAIAAAYQDIGEYYLSISDIASCAKYLKEGLEKAKASNNDYNVFMVLVKILIFWRLNKDFDEYFELSKSEYIKEFFNIKPFGENKRLINFKELVKYLLLIDENTTDSLLKAEKGLIELKNSQIDELEIQLQILLNLTKLQIKLHKIKSQKEIENKITEFTDELLAIAGKNQSKKLLAELYILKGKFAGLLQNYDESKSYLITAINITEENNLKLLLEIALREYEELLKITEVDLDEFKSELYNDDFSDFIDNLIFDQLETMISPGYHIHRNGRSVCNNTSIADDHDETNLIGETQIAKQKMVSSVRKCSSCRNLSLQGLIERIVKANLFSWVCTNCGDNLSSSRIDSLISEKKMTRKTQHPTLHIESPFFTGNLSWQCTACKYDSIIDLKEISNLFK